MPTSRKPRDEHPLLHTMEEATALLRRCPVQAWFWWFVGSAPFVCCVLHFWSDMSRAADARSRLAESALYLALAYGFMKVAHAVFGDHLLCLLRGDDEPAPLPLRGKLRVVSSQVLIQCTSPWVMVLASAAVLPTGWVYAFYHNANILALSVFREGGRTRDLFRRAFTQCQYRPGQNHSVMTVLLLFSALVWLNIAIGSYMGAILMKSFTGVENGMTRNPWLFFSPGFLTVTMGLSYLIVGPFVKASYAVRCFYGLSRRNGEDIMVRFRHATGLTQSMVAAALLAFFASQGIAAPSTSMAPAPPPAAPHTVDPTALDKNIRDVMQEDAFQWRMPRDSHEVKDEELGWFGSFVRDTTRWVKSVFTSIGNFFDGLIKDRMKEWLRKFFGGDHPSVSESGASTPWADIVQGVLYILLVVVIVVLAVLLWRQWRKMPPAIAAPSAAKPEIDLRSDQVIATQLAENEWLRLAQQNIDAGEYRLALRALFLATLAHLGERRMLLIVKSKSNGDYDRELGLRARDKTQLRGFFREQTRVFDRVWYGWHDVTRDLLEQFRVNHQRIVSDGPQ